MSKLPDSLPTNEKVAAKRTMLTVGTAIILRKKFYFAKYVLLGLSCVEASVDRAKWLVSVLPSHWWVDVYTWRSGLHTLNVAYFRGSDNKYHCYLVDGYGYPVTDMAVKYLTSIDTIPGNSLMNGDFDHQMHGATFGKHKVVGFPMRALGKSQAG